MTDGLREVISQLTSTPPTYFTASTGPASINDSHDCHTSSTAVLSSLLADPTTLLPSTTSGILVCCYSEHPLVPLLKDLTPVPVVGIFEASVSTALLLLPSVLSKFGIVSTGKVWEQLLSDGVERYFGVEKSARFAGVETTGLSAVELHETDAAEVKEKMIAATRRLVKRGGVGAVLLGCAGMVDMDAWVREACVLELGEEEGAKVHVVDGVKVGFAALEALVKSSSRN
ncbi:allantoin racemase, partial [Phenoliferia sp. Uapishka_3]